MGSEANARTSSPCMNFVHRQEHHVRALHVHVETNRPGRLVQVFSVGRIEVGTVPQVYSLSKNYPDLFNPTTTITYSLPGDENIRLAVYDILGSEVGVLVSGVQTAGSHQVMFSGSNLGSGIYFYKLESSGQTIIKKMILLK